jgi:hypothetical protein
LDNNFATFPTTAPYSRDKLQFTKNYLDEILKWKTNTVEELKNTNTSHLFDWLLTINDKPLYSRMDVARIIKKYVKKEILGDEKKKNEVF